MSVVRAFPVSYMSSSNQVPKSANSFFLNSLFTLSESPLSHPPSYSVSCPAGCPESNSEDYPVSYSESNPESSPDDYPENHRENYPPGYSDSYGESCPESYSASSSLNCLDDSSEDNSENYLPSYWENYPEDYSEGYSADSVPGYLPSSRTNYNHLREGPLLRPIQGLLSGLILSHNPRPRLRPGLEQNARPDHLCDIQLDTDGVATNLYTMSHTRHQRSERD